MSFKRISVLIPTRHRTERLKTLFESFEATVDNIASAEFIFRIDDDDPETKQFLIDMSNEDRIKTVVGPRYQGYDSMPLFFNEMFRVATGDVLMCGNDDMIFRTVGWPEKLLEAANRFPDGIFDLGVRTHNEEHYPFSTISKRVVNHLGFIWDPRIFWGDIYLRDLMKWFDRTIMIPEVEIEHDWAGWKPDKIFDEADKDIVRRFPNYWTEIHPVAVNDAINRLQELRA